MTFRYEERASRVPCVDVVWQTVDLSGGTYLAAADACWDLIVTRMSQRWRILLSGPSSRPTTVRYSAGNRNVGVRFTQGTYVTAPPVDPMFDRTIELRTEHDSFELGGLLWPIPDYQGVDDLLETWVSVGLLAHDDVVDTAIGGEAAGAPLSERSVQRHIAKVTGLSAQRVRQITRARLASELLRSGRPIAEVAYELGYADQAHMTRDIKRLTGYTPGRAQVRGEPV